MGMGPITIFDKSTLQSLTDDESVWLDAFFLINVVPLFYVETLADLEKEVAEGRSAEDLVGMLAERTPDKAVPNVHHSSLISAELLTGWAVPMTGQVPIAAGDVMVASDGTTGVHVDEFEEAAALDRWQNHQFLEIEREVAKRWRSELIEDDRDRKIGVLRNTLPAGSKISDLSELKKAIDTSCDSAEKEVLALALDIVGVPAEAVPQVMARWDSAGRPKLESFAPYTAHVFKVDLVYYLGIDRGFISGDRPSNKADMAYLYYLPFSMLFTSGDKLHRRTAPLFLRPDQSFAEAMAFKAALKELDEYYDRLPDEVKALGVMVFAQVPPPDLKNFVVELWDKHARGDWRAGVETPEQILARHAAVKESADEIRTKIETAQPVVEEEALRQRDPDYIVIRRQVPVRKGKWRLLPEEVEDSGQEADSA